MMTSAPTAPDAEVLRPLSIHAVISGVLGGISLLAWIAPTFVAVAIVAALCGVTSAMRLRGRSAEVAGLRLAIGGVAVSSMCLFGASLWHWHRYAIEVPDGYERVSLAVLWELLPQEASDDQVVEHTRAYGETVEIGESHGNASFDLEGRRIAVKVYAEPTGEIAPNAFAVRNSAASGAYPLPANCIIVRLPSGRSWEYTDSPIVVAGVLRRISSPEDGKQWLVLDDATVRQATSSIGLPARRRNC